MKGKIDRHRLGLLGLLGMLAAAPLVFAPAAQAATVEGTSTTLIQLRQRYLLGLDGGTSPVFGYEFDAPLIEWLTVRGEGLADPRLKGLSIRVGGWAAVEMADVLLDARVTGELNFGFLRYAGYGAEVRLGRQLLFTGHSRGARIDGAYLRYDPPIGLSIEAYGGWTALPRFGKRPELFALGSRADGLVLDPAMLPPGSTRGYALGGGRLSWRCRFGGVGVDFLHEQEASNPGRQQFGFDLSVTPVRFLSLYGSALYDTIATAFAEGRALVEVEPLRGLFLRAGYESRDPSLFLSKTSVLSVFALGAYQDIGADIRYRISPRLSAEAGYHRLILPEENDAGDRGSGDQVFVRGRLGLGRGYQGLVAAEYRFLREPDNGYHMGRLALAYALPPRVPLEAGLDTYFFSYQKEVNGQSYAASGNAYLEARFGRVAAVGSLGVGVTPLAESDLRGLLKLTVQFDAPAREVRR